ncbi:DUF4157 domain-containing protein [Streptomyces sp. NPDC090021]|uniref:eCIS core domain-containing protein n=1 Tax=Streptomyces sp. NPDC090021 TaxID=3365919 RepID=UPI003800EBA2
MKNRWPFRRKRPHAADPEGVRTAAVVPRSPGPASRPAGEPTATAPATPAPADGTPGPAPTGHGTPMPAPVTQPADGHSGERSWARLEPLRSGLGRGSAPLTAAGPPVAVRPHDAMLGGPRPAGDRPAAPAGRVEGLATLVPLLPPRPVVVQAAPQPATPVPAALEPAMPQAPAPPPVLPAPPPPVRPAVVERTAVSGPGLTTASERYVGEPRPATESTHLPAWMNAGPVGSGFDLSALLSPPDAPDTPSPRPAPRPPATEPGGPVHQRRRRTLGESRRLGLGPVLAHRPAPDVPDAETRPPPEPSPAPAPMPLPHTTPSATPASVTAETRHPAAHHPPTGIIVTPGMPVRQDPAHASAASLPPAAAAPSDPVALHHRSSRRERPDRAPDDLTHSISALHGTDLADTPLHRGTGAARATESLGARAFARDAQVFLPDGQGPVETPRIRGLIAHELVHVAQQKRYGSALPPEDSPGGKALEAEALSAERYYRGDPGAPKPLVHRRPVTAAGPDPEDVRELVEEMNRHRAGASAYADAPAPARETPAPPASGPSGERHEAPPTGGGTAARPSPASGERDGEHTGPGAVASLDDLGLRGAVWTPETGLVRAGEMPDPAPAAATALAQVPVHGVQRASSEQVLEDYIAMLNHRNRNRGDAKHLGVADLDPAQQEDVEFLIERAVAHGALVQATDDEDEDDGTGWRGEAGLVFTRALTTPFGVDLDRRRRQAIRRFFAGGRSAPPGAASDVEARFDADVGDWADTEGELTPDDVGAAADGRTTAAGEPPVPPTAKVPQTSRLRSANPPGRQDGDTGPEGPGTGSASTPQDGVWPSLPWPLASLLQHVDEVRTGRAGAFAEDPAHDDGDRDGTLGPPTAAAGAETASADPSAPPHLDDDIYLERLAGRLYGHIRTRLRQELLVDRERSGRLTDLR